jgi:hypothetical protein
MRKIEARIESERHNRGRGMRGSLPGQHGHLAAIIHANCVIPGGKRKDAIEMITLDPILQFSGLIAGVFADFKHRDHHDLHGNAMRSRRKRRDPNHRDEHRYDERKRPFCDEHTSIIWKELARPLKISCSLFTREQYRIEIIRDKGKSTVH